MFINCNRSVSLLAPAYSSSLWFEVVGNGGDSDALHFVSTPGRSPAVVAECRSIHTLADAERVPRRSPSVSPTEPQPVRTAVATLVPLSLGEFGGGAGAGSGEGGLELEWE